MISMKMVNVNISVYPEDNMAKLECRTGWMIEIDGEAVTDQDSATKLFKQLQFSLPVEHFSKEDFEV